MRRLALVAVVMAATACSGAPAPSHGGGNQAAYYVSLGDSVAAGVQPTPAGQSVPTDHGFADQLYALLAPGDPGLQLHKLACGGETTTTLINGAICGYTGGDLTSDSARKGTQLGAALTFLDAHRGHVPLITIAIGANDVLSCLNQGTPAATTACAQQEIPVMRRNLTEIVTRLRAADPSGTIIGMTYADVALAAWRRGAGGQAFASSSLVIAAGFRTALIGVYRAGGARVADAYTAFKTPDMTDRITVPGFGTLPEDVGLVCEWTWFCTAPPQGPNIHPNTAGYGVIARTFLAADGH